MRRWILSIACLLLVNSAARAELKIVTTLTDFADFAKQIGGDRVTVHSVMKGPENVHNVMARPTEMVFLNKADLFVHSGLDAEPWRDNLLKGARNPRVLAGKPGNVDMSAGVELREVPAAKVDRSQGDVHAYGNPHYTTDPRNALRMVATLAKAMSDADPANADFYRDNARRLVNEIADLTKELKAKLAPYGGLKVVTYHKSWEYFADAFGLDIVTAIEPKPAITPSPADMRRVIEQARAAGVRVVIVETYNSLDQAKFVADQIGAGATALRLPDHVNGTPEAGGYQAMLRHDVEQIVKAVEAAGVAKGGAK
jgi:zinc/manganese transport system substrate-binding protein